MAFYPVTCAADVVGGSAARAIDVLVEGHGKSIAGTVRARGGDIRILATG